MEVLKEWGNILLFAFILVFVIIPIFLGIVKTLIEVEKEIGEN